MTHGLVFYVSLGYDNSLFCHKCHILPSLFTFNQFSISAMDVLVFLYYFWICINKQTTCTKGPIIFFFIIFWDVQSIKRLSTTAVFTLGEMLKFSGKESQKINHESIFQSIFICTFLATTNNPNVGDFLKIRIKLTISPFFLRKVWFWY